MGTAGLTGLPPTDFAGVAELVDALDLGSSDESRMGSSPFVRTMTLETGNVRVFGVCHEATRRTLRSSNLIEQIRESVWLRQKCKRKMG